MNEEQNRKLFEWLTGGCAHETRFLSDDERGPVYGFFGTFKCYKHSGLASNCIKCGEPIHLNIGIFNGVPTVYGFPNYSKESGFFSLLAGLKSKGYGYVLESSGEVCRVELWEPNDSFYSASDHVADTLPEALFNAAIKAMESGSGPSHPRVDERGQKGADKTE